MNWRFFLDDLEIDEPQGFSDISFNIMRDQTWHGVLFEASTSSLRFYGKAFDYLKTAKQGFGVDAKVVFLAESRCEGQETWEEVIKGRLNFSNYRETCGQDCFVILSVEQEGCAMILKNRFDQKVALDSTLAFDKQTQLEDYSGLSFPMELATQDIPVSVEGYVVDEGDYVDLEIFLPETRQIFVRPQFARVIDESINQSNLIGSTFAASPNLTNEHIISPVFLLDDPLSCITEDFQYDFRLKGSYNINIQHVGPGSFDIEYVKLYAGYGEFPDSMTTLAELPLSSSGEDAIGVFDWTQSGSLNIPQGQGFYTWFELKSDASAGSTILNPESRVIFDKETHFLASNTRQCPPTDAEVYLAHEALSRATEAITDRCLSVKSDYYGRVDSEPYASPIDGCGGLRVITNGLRIRQAENKEFFVSLKDLLEGLNAIDNIGFGIEGDQLRVEPVEYFYQDTEVLKVPLVPRLETQTQQNLVRSVVKIGYKKWEIQSTKGIDEFNSNKEFATSITSITNPLDQTSSLVASGYVIDQLRTSSLAATGQADSSYDNDTFIIVVERDAYGFHVEQGAANATGLFSPDTAYNWRIRPFSNLMRWGKSIFPAYPQLANSASKIFFRSGTGNYLASGELTDSNCKLENGTKAENDDLSAMDYLGGITPIWKPETITFDYPLSVSEYRRIKANPLGYISVQCGQGEFIKAYISNIEYTPASGEAKFNLLVKWQ